MRLVGEVPLIDFGGPLLINISDTERSLVPDELFTVVD
jgi:hypothetical protein